MPNVNEISSKVNGIESEQTNPAWLIPEMLYAQRFYYDNKYLSTAFKQSRVTLKSKRMMKDGKQKRISKLTKAINKLSFQIGDFFQTTSLSSVQNLYTANRAIKPAIQPLNQLNNIINLHLNKNTILTDSAIHEEVKTTNTPQTIPNSLNQALENLCLNLKKQNTSASNVLVKTKPKVTKSKVTDLLWNMTYEKILYYNRLHLMQFLMPNCIICGLCDSKSFYNILPEIHISDPSHKKTLDYWIHSRIPPNLIKGKNKKDIMFMEKIHITLMHGQRPCTIMNRTKDGIFHCPKCPRNRQFRTEEDAVYHTVYGHKLK